MIAPDPDRFFRDLIADAIGNVVASQWRERAQALRAARPRHGDFHGRATREALNARWERLARLADMCDAKAALLEGAPADVAVPEIEDFPIWEAA